MKKVARTVNGRRVVVEVSLTDRDIAQAATDAAADAARRSAEAQEAQSGQDLKAAILAALDPVGANLPDLVSDYNNVKDLAIRTLVQRLL